MTYFLINILLAVSWAALSGSLTLENLVGGFIIGYLMLFVSRRALGCTNYVTKVPRVISFFLYFLQELILANIRVAYEVLSPSHTMIPAIVAIPLDVRSDIEILVLANVITLTPGTLSLDVSDDRRVLYIHAMYVDDIEAFRREIKDGFERRIQELFE